MAKLFTFFVVCNVLSMGCQAQSTNHNLGISNKASSSGSGSGNGTTAGTNDSGDNQVLATVGDVAITVGQFRAEIDRLSPHVRAKYQNVSERKEFLETMIRYEVLAQEAIRRKLNQDPQVVRHVQQVIIQKLIAQEQVDWQTSQVSEQDALRYYEQHKSDYHKPDRVRVMALITKDKKLAQDTVKKAKKGANPLSLPEFQSLAQTKDSAPNKADPIEVRDLGFLTADTPQMPKTIVKAAFALTSTGDIGGPIYVNDSYYILRRTGFRKAVSRPFEGVRLQIVSKLKQLAKEKAQDQFIAELRKSADIVTNDDALSTLHTTATQNINSEVSPASPTAGTQRPPRQHKPEKHPHNDHGHTHDH